MNVCATYLTYCHSVDMTFDNITHNSWLCMHCFSKDEIINNVVSVMLCYVSVHITTLNALHSTLWLNHSLLVVAQSSSTDTQTSNLGLCWVFCLSHLVSCSQRHSSYLTFVGTMFDIYVVRGEDCITTILPDKDDRDNLQHYNHYYTTNASYYRTNISCLRL
jgi:hypothetical protein